MFTARSVLTCLFHSALLAAAQTRPALHTSLHFTIFNTSSAANLQFMLFCQNTQTAIFKIKAEEIRAAEVMVWHNMVPFSPYTVFIVIQQVFHLLWWNEAAWWLWGVCLQIFQVMSSGFFFFWICVFLSNQKGSLYSLSTHAYKGFSKADFVGQLSLILVSETTLRPSCRGIKVTEIFNLIFFIPC